MRGLNKLSDVVNTAAEYFCVIALGIMSVVVFAQVVFHLPPGSLPWSEELARYLMVYMVYIGTITGVKRCSRIVAEVIMDRCPLRTHRPVPVRTVRCNLIAAEVLA